MTQDEYDRQDDERQRRDAAVILAGLCANPKHDTTAKGLRELARRALTVAIQLQGEITDHRFQCYEIRRRRDKRDANSD